MCPWHERVKLRENQHGQGKLAIPADENRPWRGLGIFIVKFSPLAIALFIVAFWGTGSPLAALDAYWEEKLVKGIEGWMVRPLFDLKEIPKRSEEYNQFVKRVKILPDWLEKPTDLDQIKRRLPPFEQALLSDLKVYNEQKIPSLGIFNTQWTEVLADPINLKEVENIFRRIYQSLNGEQKQKDLTEKVCRACVKELEAMLGEIPLFTQEFRASFSYGRGQEATYRGNRLVAGLIEHYKDFHAVEIQAFSQDHRSLVSFAGHRVIEGNASPEPNYAFSLDPPPASLHPAWKALELRPSPQGLRFVGYFSLKGSHGQEKRKDLTCALLAFDRKEEAQKFWKEGKKIQREGTKEFAYLTLERVSWQGAKGRHSTYGSPFGPYILLVQPHGDPGKGGEEVNYLLGRLVQPK